MLYFYNYSRVTSTMQFYVCFIGHKMSLFITLKIADTQAN